MKKIELPIITHKDEKYFVDVKKDKLICTTNPKKTLNFIDVYNELSEESRKVIYRAELQISEETADLVMSLS